MSIKKCPIPEQQKPIEKPEGSRVSNAVVDFFTTIRSRAGVLTPKEDLELMWTEEIAKLTTGAANIPVIKQHNVIEDLLARALGYQSTMFGAVNGKKTAAGAFQDLLITNAKIASNTINYMTTYKSLPVVKELYEKLVKALPDLSENRIQELLHDQVVIGLYPELLNVVDSPVAQQQLRMRYFKHHNNLLEAGLTTPQIQELDKVARTISKHFDEARFAAGKFGLDVEQLQNGGFYPLRTKDYIKKFLDKETGLGANKPAESFLNADVINKSRSSMVPLVLDVDKAATVLGTDTITLTKELLQPGLVTQRLRELPEETLEKLFDNGTLGQLPAMSDELMVFFNEALDLPIENLGQAIMMNPVEAIKRYDEQLTRAITNSSYMQTTLEEGVKNGWLLDTYTYAALGNVNKKNFVQLGSDNLLLSLVRNQKTREAISEMYVHKTAISQLNALVQVNSSYEALGLLGGFIQNFVKLTGGFKRAALVASSPINYVKRVATNNFIGVYAATGLEGVGKLAVGLTDTVRIYKDKTLDALPDVTYKVGNTTISLKEAYTNLLLKRASSFAAGLGEQVETTSVEKLFNTVNPRELATWWKYTELYNSRYGSPVSGKILTAAELAKEVTSESFKAVYETMAHTNQFLDFTARWTIARAVLDNPKLAGVPIKSFDDIIRYTDEYISINEVSGEVGKAASKFLVPFASFALVAPGSMIRHAMRHPWRYARSMYLYSQVQNSLGETLSENEASKWNKSSYNLFLSRTADGKIISVNPGTVDFYLDSSLWIKENFEKAIRLLGGQVGTQQEILDAGLNPNIDFQNAMKDVANKLYYSEALQILVGGVNPRTGSKYSKVPEQDILMGVIPMSRQLKDGLTSAIPMLRYFDRNLPASIVGSPTVTNEFGTVVEPGRPSVSGIVPETGGAKGKIQSTKEAERELFPFIANNLMGLTLSEIDPQKNLISNYKDFSTRDADINLAVSRINSKLIDEPNSVNEAALLEQRRYLLAIKGYLEVTKLSIDLEAQRKGMTPPSIVQNMLTTKRNLLNFKQEALLKYLEQLED
jgi:hypothetical protein